MRVARSLQSTAFFSGILGALIMSVVMGAVRGGGGPNLPLERELGAFLTGRGGAGSWALGFAWHLLNGGVFALVYAAGFRLLGRAGFGMGVVFGIVHWYLAGYIIGLFPVWRLPAFFQIAPWTSAPDVEYGGPLTVFTFFLHVVYGIVVGVACGSFLKRQASGAPLPRAERDEAA